MPLESVVTEAAPTRFIPWPNPLWDAVGLAKNWIRKVVIGIEYSEPLIVVVDPSLWASDRVG